MNGKSYALEETNIILFQFKLQLKKSQHKKCRAAIPPGRPLSRTTSGCLMVGAVTGWLDGSASKSGMRKDGTLSTLTLAASIILPDVLHRLHVIQQAN
jgi:hypothetical protein